MVSETPLLQPIKPGYHIRLLSDEQLGQFKSATLHILEEVGVHCPSAKAREIYAAQGAQVDPASQVVRLSPDLVLRAMSHAPRFYTMGARLPSHDIRLDGTAMYCATDGCGVETIDFETRKRRTSCKEDIARMARLADYLPSVGFYWPMVSAQDHPSSAPLHELEASYNHTVKHVQTETVMDELMARYAVEMATVIAGDTATLRARPPLSSLVCTIAPLAQDLGGMEAALVFAEAGIPVGFMSMANTGSTAPATIAGTLSIADAEIVAALVLVQLAFPGAPVYYSMMPGVTHPRTGAYLSTTWEIDVAYAAGVELAHMWGVPTLAAMFGPDAPVPGWQSAAEVASSLLLDALCGAETGSGMGLLESCTLLYPEELVLAADIYHRVRITAEAIDTSPQAMALDVIKAVGPRGHFLGHRHTRQAMRRLRFSELTAQPEPSGGFRDPVMIAQDKVKWVLENHYPQPLEASQQAELSRILQAAERAIIARD
ncbi:MAG: trimethylamine methyltransferase family protein [Chloroflexota bacterium]